MNVAFILFNNTERAPYLNYYTAIAERLGVNYDIILWNRLNKNYFNKPNYYYYKLPITTHYGKLSKIIPFFRYRSFVKTKLKEKKYERVVVFTSQQAMLLCGYLISEKIKYVVDIRDYSCEKIPGVNFLLKRYVKKSDFTVISAPDFRNFLPKADYVLCHNIGEDTSIKECSIAENSKKIIIAYVGGLSYFNEVSKFILSIKNDSRFLFEFYGGGDKTEGLLKTFCNQNDIRNCLFYGEYSPKDKDIILSKVNILYNCYGNNNNVVKYALSNKLYDAFKFGLPLLVSPNTSMEKTAGSLALPIKTNDPFNGDKISNWYRSINWPLFQKKAHEQYNLFLRDNKEFDQRLSNFIHS